MRAGGQYKEKKMDKINKVKNTAYADNFTTKEKEEELLRNCYKIVVKAVYVKNDKYDFTAYKIRTRAGKWIDLWINYSDKELVNLINYYGVVEIYIKRGFVSYSVNDKGYYVATLADWYVAQEFIDKNENK